MNTARTVVGVLVLAVGLAAAPRLEAQAWDAPSFLSPRPTDELGLFLISPDGADWGLVGMWRQGGAINLGVRAGLASGPGDTRFLVGSDLWGPVARAGLAFPLDVAWAVGLGATFGDGTLFRFPVGLSAGRSFGANGFSIYPYVHPRIALDLFEIANQSDTELTFSADIGVTLMVGAEWMVRFAAVVGDYSGWGLGAGLVRGRRVVVR